MPYSAAQIANDFIRRGLAEGIVVDPLKIQKLVYLAHGWHLEFLKSPLIREDVEAWPYGPVVPSLYRRFRKYGYSTITEEVPIQDGERVSDVDRRLLDEVWKVYKDKSGIELSVITHEPGYAWDLTRRSNPNSWAVIPMPWIAEEFRRRKTQK